MPAAQIYFDNGTVVNVAQLRAVADSDPLRMALLTDGEEVVLTAEQTSELIGKMVAERRDTPA